jgi:hypothetical protein
MSGSGYNLLYLDQDGPAGGRLRRPSSRRQPHDGHRGAGLTLNRCRRSGGPEDRLPQLTGLPQFTGPGVGLACRSRPGDVQAGCPVRQHRLHAILTGASNQAISCSSDLPFPAAAEHCTPKHSLATVGQPRVISQVNRPIIGEINSAFEATTSYVEVMSFKLIRFSAFCANGGG